MWPSSATEGGSAADHTGGGVKYGANWWYTANDPLSAVSHFTIFGRGKTLYRRIDAWKSEKRLEGVEVADGGEGVRVQYARSGPL